MNYIKFYNDMNMADLQEHLKALKAVLACRIEVEKKLEIEDVKFRRAYNGREFPERKCWGPCGGTFKPNGTRQLFCKLCLSQMRDKKNERMQWVQLRESEGWVKDGPNRTE